MPQSGNGTFRSSVCHRAPGLAAGAQPNSAGEPTGVSAACDCFGSVDVWVFDLDNTLYPAECDLFAQVADRMNAFIIERLSMSEVAARKLRRDYYLRYGTTLAGLMKHHSVVPDDFLAYVHDIDHSPLEPNPRLAAAISLLPGRKLIFTNGSRRHAEDVAGRIGILPLFDDIFDIKDGDYIPKPHADTFARFVSRHGIDAPRAAMFEDLPHNLETAHAIGMTTVLVHSDYDDHPSQREAQDSASPFPHIHHLTHDLTGFVTEIAARVSSTV